MTHISNTQKKMKKTIKNNNMELAISVRRENKCEIQQIF